MGKSIPTRKGDKPENGHLKLRAGVFDHVLKGWMDSDMFLAYAVMLRQCDWMTGIWMGSAAKLAAAMGKKLNGEPNWSKSKAQRVLGRLCDGNYCVSKYEQGIEANYPFFINNYEPTLGENEGKMIRRAKTVDCRVMGDAPTPSSVMGEPPSRVTGDAPPCTSEPPVRHPCGPGASLVTTVQEYNQESQESSSTASLLASKLTVENPEVPEEKNPEILDFLIKAQSVYPSHTLKLFEEAYLTAVRCFTVRPDGDWLFRCLLWARDHKKFWQERTRTLTAFAKVLESGDEAGIIPQFLVIEAARARKGVSA